MGNTITTILFWGGLVILVLFPIFIVLRMRKKDMLTTQPTSMQATQKIGTESDKEESEKKIEREIQDKTQALTSIRKFFRRWGDSIKSKNIDANDFESLRFINNVAGDLDELANDINGYVRKYPEDAPLGFLGLFFESYRRLVVNARYPSGDLVEKHKANAKVALVSLHHIMKYPYCVEEAFRLLSEMQTIPTYLILKFDFELSTVNPQERAFAVMGIYERFWKYFVYDGVESPVIAGGAISLKAYLVKTGLT